MHKRIYPILLRLIHQAQSKLKKLQQQINSLQPTPLPKSDIIAFYKRLLKHNPTLFHKIRRLKGRRRLYPEEKDMCILCEAAGIARTNQPTFLISGDYDFTAFTDHIWTKFKVCVISLRWIPINPPDIDNLIQNPCPSQPLPPDLQDP